VQALNDVDADDGIAALIVTGAGAAFCSGFDLKEQAEKRPRGSDVWKEMLDLYSGMILKFCELRKPTIAAINGSCMAGGFELALACDLSIASELAIFGEPELQFGAGIVAMLLPWFASPKIAKRIILLGEDTISAKEALEVGLVSQVVPPSDVMSKSVGAARRFTHMDRQLVQKTKRAINAAYETMGLRSAIAQAVKIDVEIEADGTTEKHAFLDLVQSKGMKSALEWRAQRFLAND
jgi:enoyl-CoA hydratase